jgi:hypothetical protein
MLALVPPALLLAVALRCLGVSLPVLPLIAGMRVAPLLAAAAHGLGIDGIGTNFVAMVFTLASTLAGNLATDGLLRVVAGRLENLLAITAVAIDHQAAPDQNRIRSFCPAGRLNLSAPQKFNRL